MSASAGAVLNAIKYFCKVEDVASVQFVRLDKYVEGEYRYDYTVLSQIDDFESFVNRLNDMKHSANWGDPRQMEEGYIVARIEYSNGDFDFIHSDAQCFNRVKVMKKRVITVQKGVIVSDSKAGDYNEA